MKLTYSLAALVAALVVFAGCDKDKQAQQRGSESTADINAPAEQREGVKQDTATPAPPSEQKDVAKQTVTDAPPMPEQPAVAKQDIKPPADTDPYPVDMRDQFVAFQQEHLATMDQNINELNDRILSLNTDEAAQQTINSVRELRSQVDTLFEDLKKASPEAWDDAKKAYEAAYAELERVFQDAKDTYGD